MQTPPVYKLLEIGAGTVRTCEDVLLTVPSNVQISNTHNSLTRRTEFSEEKQDEGRTEKHKLNKHWPGSQIDAGWKKSKGKQKISNTICVYNEEMYNQLNHAKKVDEDDNCRGRRRRQNWRNVRTRQHPGDDQPAVNEKDNAMS
jgi:hypothetical protein